MPLKNLLTCKAGRGVSESGGKMAEQEQFEGMESGQMQDIE